jgi:hypothetical protein
MAINDTTQLAVRGIVAGQDHVHTLHFRHMALPPDSEQALIDEWQAGCRTAYRAAFITFDSPVITLTARQVCGTVPLRAPVEETEAVGNQPGTRTPSGDRLAPWLASVTSERTALAGRSRRGRYYLGGLIEADIVMADLQSAYLTLVQAYATALLTVFGPAGTSANFKLAVHSSKLAAQGLQCQDSSTLVNGLIVRSPLATMKSRKAGSGT